VRPESSFDAVVASTLPDARTPETLAELATPGGWGVNVGELASLARSFRLLRSRSRSEEWLAILMPSAFPGDVEGREGCCLASPPASPPCTEGALSLVPLNAAEL